MAFPDLNLRGFRDYRMPVLLTLVGVSLLLEIVIHWYMGIAIVYSHLFYIPVVLAAVWYGKRGVVVAIILGVFHLAGTYYTLGMIDSGSAVRSLMFVVVGLVIGALSDLTKKEQEQMINRVTDAALQSGMGGGTAGSQRDHKSRLISFASVRKLRESRDVHGLIRVLRKRDPGIQYEAAEALGDIGDPAAVGPLMEALTGDQYSGVRWKAAEALGKIGTPAVPALLTVLAHPDEDIRWKAAVTLGEIGDERAIGPLVQLLNDQDRFVRSRAAYALGLIGPPALGALSATLIEGDVETRRGAATALGMIGDPGAAAALIGALSDPSSAVRQEVIAALARQGDPAFPALVRALGDPDGERREGAALALAGSGNPEAIVPLKAALAAADPTNQAVLRQAISDLTARKGRREPPATGTEPVPDDVGVFRE